MKIRINSYICESYVDGPGIRFALFTQGCRHNCFGCHNPQTHDASKGKDMEISQIVEMMNDNPLIDGLTLTGGDPIEQIPECLELCKMVKEQEKDYDIILYTGYTFTQLLEMSRYSGSLRELLLYLDYIIDGPFIMELRDLELKYAGSSNQQIIDVQRSLKENKIIIADI